jgi:hypothetical protein
MHKGSPTQRLRKLLAKGNINMLYWPVYNQKQYKIREEIESHPNAKMSEFLSNHIMQDLFVR